MADCSDSSQVHFYFTKSSVAVGLKPSLLREKLARTRKGKYDIPHCTLPYYNCTRITISRLTFVEHFFIGLMESLAIIFFYILL